MLIIPHKILVGYTPHSEPNKAHLNGDICPVDERRKDRMTKVIKRSRMTDTYDNIPLPGFTLLSPGLNWHGKRDHWSVIHPRGFIFSISSENVAKIIECSGITEGLIQDKCVIGYNKGDIVIIPVSSEPYKLAKQNTKILDKRVYLRDVNVGDKVRLQNKIEGRYLGKWEILKESSRISPASVEFGTSTSAYLVELKYHGETIGYYYSSNIKISEVLESIESPLADDIIKKEINNNITIKDIGFYSNADICLKLKAPDPIYATEFIYATKDKNAKTELEFEEVSESTFVDYINRRCNNTNTLASRSRRTLRRCAVRYCGNDYIVHNLGSAGKIGVATLGDSDMVFTGGQIDVVDNGIIRILKVKPKSKLSRKEYLVEDRTEIILQECEKYYIISATRGNDRIF